MKASELIEKLARAIAMSGDQDVVLDVHTCDGEKAFPGLDGRATHVTDTCYADMPFRIVSRRQIQPHERALPKDGDL